MSETLLLFAHGAGDGSPVNRRIERLASRLAKRCGDRFSGVQAVFRLGSRGLTSSLLEAGRDRAVVVPLLTSEGYFFRALVEELGRFRRSMPDASVRLTQPLGTHPHLISWIEKRIEDEMARFSLTATDTTVLLVGHGTPRHPKSGDRTRSVAKALSARPHLPPVRAAFLDHHPSPEALAAATGSRVVLAVPFLLGGGPHTEVDLPRRLGLELRGDVGGSGTVGGQRRVCLAPLSADPQLARRVLELTATTVLGARAA